MGLQSLGSITILLYVYSPSSTYSLGLSEMLTGSAKQVLHTFKQILSDLELAAGPKSGGLVSDRHIVENSLLEDYRKEVLPAVVESWDQMTPEGQSGIGTLNNFS